MKVASVLAKSFGAALLLCLASTSLAGEWRLEGFQTTSIVKGGQKTDESSAINVQGGVYGNAFLASVGVGVVDTQNGTAAGLSSSASATATYRPKLVWYPANACDPPPSRIRVIEWCLSSTGVSDLCDATSLSANVEDEKSSGSLSKDGKTVEYFSSSVKGTTMRFFPGSGPWGGSGGISITPGPGVPREIDLDGRTTVELSTCSLSAKASGVRRQASAKGNPIRTIPNIGERASGSGTTSGSKLSSMKRV